MRRETRDAGPEAAGRKVGRRASPAWLIAALCCAVVALAPGCRLLKSKKTAPAQTPVATNAAPRAVQTAWAEVAYVNTAQGYVVLRAKVLQSAAGEATVWRGTNEVARLRVGGPARLPWLTADVLSGHPQPRDRVEMKW